MGSSRVVALDMVEDSSNLQRILAAITIPNVLAPNRPWCMNCKTVLRKSRGVHCRHCSRLTCFSCSHSFLPVEYFPEHFKVLEPSSVCAVCEIVLTSKKEVMTSITYPTTVFSEDDENGRFSC
jgi:IBR domain, a half RING-finger domain